MPRLVGFKDWQFEAPTPENIRAAGLEPFVEHVKTKLSRQGVRNLNTPRNGRRDTSCVHVRDPQGTATVTKPHIVLDKDTGAPKREHQAHCAHCDEALGPAD